MRTLDPLDCRTREETDAVLAWARSWSRPAAIMRALDVAGRDMLYRHGAFHEALAVYEELLAVSERFGSIPSQAEALTHIATSQMVAGDLLLGQETLRRAEEVIARLGHSHRIYKFVAISRAAVLAYFLDGDWPQLAQVALEYATSTAARSSSVGSVAAGIAVFSLARAGNVEQARDLLQHVTSIVERASPTTYAQGVAVVWPASVVWDLEATEYTATYRRLALDLLDTGVGVTGFGPLEQYVARMATLLGDFGEAQEYFERARSRLHGRGLTHYRAIVDYDQACALIRAGATNHARTVELLDAALEGFRSHGMLGWAARAAEQKEALTTATPPHAPTDGSVRTGGTRSPL